MNKIKDVPFSDFVELVQFLKFNDEETEYHNITKRLTRFIEGMNAYYSVLIDNIVKDILDDKTEDAEQLFNTFNENFGDLPWLTAMVGFPWTAYAVSQMYYYKKSEKENTVGGVKYESVMAEIRKMKEYREQVSEDYMELTYSGSEEPSNPEEGVG